MRKKRTRTPVMLALASLLASLVTFVSSGTAVAAEVPMQLVGSPISTEGVGNYATAPNGNITVGCRSWSGQDLTTYDQTGAVVQQIDRTQQIDNKPNCVVRPAVDKNGDVYGRQYDNGKVLAYDGNAVKWQYPIQCSAEESSVAVGGDGNIYTLTTESDGTHLIGLAPEVEPDQVQPARVLDIKVDEGCAAVVTAYKDGIILTKFSSNDSERTYSYFSYGGKYLGQPTFPSDIGFYAKTNSEGRLFREAGDPDNIKVVAYNPGSSSPSWTYQFPPQSSLFVDGIHSLQDGGVAVRVTEWSSPWSSKLAILSSSGYLEREILLDNEHARVTVDEGNKAVVVTIDDSVTPYRAVLRTYDISTGNAIGDAHVLGSTSAGIPDAADAVWVTDDTVYFHAACYWSVPNCDNEVKLYGARVDGVDLDYPRAEVLTAETPAQPAPVSYVAMGDSFTAGEGVEPFETGTEGGCHRSSRAYPRLLSTDPSVPLSLTSEGFIACSGAVSDAIKDGANAQMNKVTTDTDVITMTIGGNDMPVRTYITACIAGSCSGNATDEAIAGIANNVIPEVRDALEALDAHMGTVGSDAAVLVLGYPQIVSETGTAAAQGCWWYDAAEAAAMHYVTQQLNTAIKNEVDAMGSNFHFVSATDSNSPFADRDLCRADGGSYFINYNPLEPEGYTFHPNAAGQRAYATLVKNWLAQHPLS